MYVDVKFDVLCMYICTVNGPILTTQVMMSTETTAGSPETPSRDTPSSSTPNSTPSYGPEQACIKSAG